MGLGVRVNNISLNEPSTVLAPVKLDASQLFQAVTAAVPEPGAIGLMAWGVFAVGLVSRKRRATEAVTAVSGTV